jgi:uncharacterized protein (DUF305 family)
MSASWPAGLLIGALLSGSLQAAEPARDMSAMEHDHSTMAHGPAAAGGKLPTLGRSSYTAADLTFLTHMILHHQQALELCELVPTHSTREAFHRFARYVNDAQAAEIGQMQGLLKLAAGRGATIPEQRLDGDPPMTGMLSKAQMAAIGAAKGLEFERLWLQGMITHHQGAVDMALAQQNAQFRSGNQPWGVDVMVDDMLVGQRSEITKMTAWLTEWQ